MWPFRKKIKKPESTNILHGVSLDEWDFWGLSRFTYGPHTGRVFFFSQKGNVNKRLTVISGMKPDIKSHVEKYHQYIYDVVARWRVGEEEYYVPISEPSKFLKKMVFEKNGWTWDRSTSWWRSATENELYENAVDNNHKDVISSIEDNVLTVDFRRRDDH